MTSFPAITALLAHRDSMLLIERVVVADSDRVVVSAKVDGAAWYVDEHGDMPAWLGIELMAQAVAAWVGLQAWQRGEAPKRGFLLGTRDYSCCRPSFPAGSELAVSATEAFRESNGLAAFACTIERSGEVIAESVLKVFEPPNFEAFMEQQI
jgi:predicted hotdog family 3-hydroxylacyl-ACP dehydratase